MDELPATVVTVSDQIATGTDANRAGVLAVELLAAHAVRAQLVTVRDRATDIADAVLAAVAEGSRLVLTSGGTGIGPADVTVEAVAPLLSYQVPGIAEEIRRRGAQHAAVALVSRGVAGVIVGNPSTFVLTAPGSRGGVRDAIDIIGPLLGHIVAQLDGAGHT